MVAQRLTSLPQFPPKSNVLAAVTVLCRNLLREKLGDGDPSGGIARSQQVTSGASDGLGRWGHDTVRADRNRSEGSLRRFLQTPQLTQWEESHAALILLSQRGYQGDLLQAHPHQLLPVALAGEAERLRLFGLGWKPLPHFVDQ